MKKNIILLLMIVMALCLLVGCSKETDGDGKKDSIDVSKAISVTPSKVYDDVAENEAKAKQNVYRVTSEIDEIKGDYLTIDNLKVYLPSSELANMSKGNNITFVGSISNVTREEYEMGGGLFTEIWIEFNNVIVE